MFRLNISTMNIVIKSNFIWQSTEITSGEMTTYTVISGIFCGGLDILTLILLNSMHLSDVGNQIAGTTTNIAYFLIFTLLIRYQVPIINCSMYTMYEFLNCMLCVLQCCCDFCSPKPVGSTDCACLNLQCRTLDCYKICCTCGCSGLFLAAAALLYFLSQLEDLAKLISALALLVVGALGLLIAAALIKSFIEGLQVNRPIPQSNEKKKNQEKDKQNQSQQQKKQNQQQYDQIQTKPNYKTNQEENIAGI